MADYDHIEIIKEELVKSYRFKPNMHAPKPFPRDRRTYGTKLKNELEQTYKNIEASRREGGIQSDTLLVLEITSDAMSPDVLENMLRKFRLYLVEETAVANTNNSKLVIQFEDKSALDVFNNERDLWENDVNVTKILTYAQRRDLFNCIENIRNVSRQDRMGNRLKKCVEDPMSLPKCFFVVDIDVWFNGDRSKIIEIERQIISALGTQGSQLLGDLFEIPSLLLGRARVNEFTLNVLLDLDIIANVELPCSMVSTESYELYSDDFEPVIEIGRAHV